MSSVKASNIRKDSINQVSQIPVHRWNVDQVKIWLTENRLSQFILIFEGLFIKILYWLIFNNIAEKSTNCYK